MATPESKVKAWLDKTLLKAYPRMVRVNPIGGPYAQSGVSDKLYCIEGLLVAVETKAKAPKPTALQADFLWGVARAGGVALCVGGDSFTAYHGEKSTTGPRPRHEIVESIAWEIARAKGAGV